MIALKERLSIIELMEKKNELEKLFFAQFYGIGETVPFKDAQKQSNKSLSLASREIRTIQKEIKNVDEQIKKLRNL